MQPFSSARSRAQLVDVLVAAQLALAVFELLGWIVVALLGDGELGRMFIRGAWRTAPFELVLVSFATVVFALWARRVADELAALGGGAPAVAPDTAVLLTLVPVVNFIGVPLVARALWLGSDPTPPPGRRAERLTALWLAAIGLSLVGLFAGPDVAVEHTRLYAAVQGAATAAWLVAGAVCLHVVRAVQARHEAQARDAAERQSVPAPSAERLR